MNLSPRRILPSFVLFSLAVILAACTAAPQPPAPSSTPATPAATIAPTAVPTPTAQPARVLTVCLGYEPTTLYVNGAPSPAMWSVLEGLYDGPIDARSYGAVPVIVEKVPNLADGDLTVTPVTVAAGDEVINTRGELVTLAAGVQVMPSGCMGGDCLVTYDGSSPLQMDQVSATYRIRPGILWSDGTPLTAADSVFAYTVAAAPETQVNQYLVDRTATYTALDELAVQWVGKPGFVNVEVSQLLWLPLPSHQLNTYSPAQLLALDATNRSPLGWGPYQVREWVAGDHITLDKNPNYFRAAEGLPKFDHLVYRFMSDNGSANLQALLAGECDVLDQSTFLEDQLQALRVAQANGQIAAQFVPGPEVEYLNLGIRPASYDDGYNAALDRFDFFGDPRTRQAVAMCLNRVGAVQELFFDLTSIPAGYVPAQHPLYNANAAVYPYDPGRAAALLDEIGWKDTDGDPATPRVSQGVKNIPDGMTFAVNYQVSNAELREAVSGRFRDQLTQCGLQVNLLPQTPGELYPAGPQGPVFGRSFDLVQFSWEPELLPACHLFTTNQIPAADNRWVGVNVAGYSSAEYDAACLGALNSIPGSPAQQSGQQLAQEIFARDLPVIPLYQKLLVAASRADLCGYSIDPTTRSGLWNLEAFDYGPGCGG